MPLETKACLTPFGLAHEAEQAPVALGGLVEAQRRARIGRQAVAAEAGLALLEQLAAQAPHVRGRPADVGDRAAEVVARAERGGLLQDRLLAAALDRAALVERDRAERAVGHAAAVRVDRPAHGLERGDAAGRVVVGMPHRAGRAGRRTSRPRPARRERAAGAAARTRAPCVCASTRELGLFSSRTAWKSSISFCASCCSSSKLGTTRAPGGTSAGLTSSQVPRMPESDSPRSRRSCDLERRALAHPPHEQVGLRVDQHRAAHLLFPVVPVPQSPRSGLEAADHDRQAGEVVPRERRVGDRRAIGPPHAAAGPVDVDAALALRGGVVRDHRVDGPRGHAHEQSRCGQPLPARAVRLEIRTVEHPDAVALRLEVAADHRVAEARVVDVAVAGDDQHVELVPAESFHLRARARQEISG